jgi:N-sulfoglucosamine sulfohydrolase
MKLITVTLRSHAATRYELDFFGGLPMCCTKTPHDRKRRRRTARNLLSCIRDSQQIFTQNGCCLNAIAAVAAALMFAVSAGAAVAAQPNILWITAEDMSPALGCYGDHYATTPNIDQLAAESVRYTHAFATAPVCSPVRSCLITGCYATSLGTHNMRSAFPLPASVRGFPAWLRNAGYFTSNNVKTDYNTSDAARLINESWGQSSDTAHWRNRQDKAAPFFSVFNLMTSHQSRTMVWPYETFQAEVQSKISPAEIHDPADAPLPPYYPDTPIIRRDWARFYDCVTVMDQQVGAILQQLKDDGLDDDTIVFFFSDHGSGMPRHKRALFDTGMHVPLLIRFPQKYQHLAPVRAGATTDSLVSFVDFPPTVLNLCRQSIPGHMHGQAFLGEDLPAAREFAFGHRDRVDEAFDCARSVRSKDFLYIRNFMPHLSYNQPTAWPDQGDIRGEIYARTHRDTMTAAQWQFAGPTRPREELFDCRTDPQNLHNLANSADHKSELAKMRDVLAKSVRRYGDRGFIPESLLQNRLAGTQSKTADGGHAASAAAVKSAFATVYELLKLHKSSDAAVRYWATIGLGQKKMSWEIIPAMLTGLTDPAWAVRIEAARILTENENPGQALPVLIEAAGHTDLNNVLHAVRTIELLGDRARPAISAVRRVAQRCQSILPTATTATFVQTAEQDLAMFISFSANAFLNGQTNADQPDP